MALRETLASPVEEAARPIDQEADFLVIQDVDYIEFYVGNAFQAAYFWQTALGFEPVAYRGLETGSRDTVTHVLQQGKIRLLFTGSYRPDSAIAAHQLLHGDGVKVVAFRVKDAEQAFRATVERGAMPVEEPTEHRDEHGVVRTSAIATYGDTIHRFVERDGYGGPFLPGFAPPRPGAAASSPVGLAHVDHIVGNVQLGKMNHWVNFYHRIMGFRLLQHFDDNAISTEYSALMSKVMQNGTGRIKLPINEPAEGRRKSQIEEYLEYFRGPGVQHIAMSTGDIISAVRELSRRGVSFLRVPDAYYDVLPDRVGPIREDLEAIRELGILVDRDDEGYLLQIFSRPLQDRPTLFVELIERHGSQGFGVGNFKALFESLEVEQARRGNL